MLPKSLILYNNLYIRPDRVSETLYHADRGWILNFKAIYMKRRSSGRCAAERRCSKNRHRYVKSDEHYPCYFLRIHVALPFSQEL